MNSVEILGRKMKVLNRLMLAVVSTVAVNSFAVSSAVTQEIDRQTLCDRFPLNSRCEDYQSTETESKIYQLDRNSFCDKFSSNSKCQQPATEIVKLNLDSLGENEEWIWIEKQANKIKLLHTTKVKDALVSGALNGALGALVPIPLPFVEANKYNWEDSRVTQVAFTSDSCQTNSCTITGTDSLTLPKRTNIYGGLFTISYQEKELKRSLEFRVPPKTKVETIDTVTIEVRQ